MRAIRLDSARLFEIARFYRAALINAMFGFGIYAIFVKLGFNMYVAQILGHILGVIFNYFTYSRHVFRDAESAKVRFLMVYAVNYFLSLASLSFVSIFIISPYLAGILALVLTSVINYFALKYIVFVKRTAG